MPIPEPLALGRPSKNYPWHWSIYRWIEGESAQSVLVDNSLLPLLASDLAQFLTELHKISTRGGPGAGQHNYFRGGCPSVYNVQTMTAIAQLSDSIDSTAAIHVWEKALSSQWKKNPVSIHGDFSAGNILVQDNRLAAVIDFGCMGIGDPACDLVIAWTFFANESRKVFRSQVGLDSDTWARARGWALWKALTRLLP